MSTPAEFNAAIDRALGSAEEYAPFFPHLGCKVFCIAILGRPTFDVNSKDMVGFDDGRIQKMDATPKKKYGGGWYWSLGEVRSEPFLHR